MSVAQTILDQLGGRKRLEVMCGSKHFHGDHNSLTFNLPSNMTKGRVNYVRITLTPEDLYEVEYLRVRGTKMDTVQHSKGVFAETLKQDIEANTGMYLSL